MTRSFKRELLRFLFSPLLWSPPTLLSAQPVCWPARTSVSSRPRLLQLLLPAGRSLGPLHVLLLWPADNTEISGISASQLLQSIMSSGQSHADMVFMCAWRTFIISNCVAAQFPVSTVREWTIGWEYSSPTTTTQLYVQQRSSVSLRSDQIRSDQIRPSGMSSSPTGTSGRE